MKVTHISIKLLQGTLIGLGGVLPGISGGTLCAVFGIYKDIVELMANPFGRLKTHVPKLIPVGIGAMIGFIGFGNTLAFLLEKYPAPSICVFIGLTVGMIPALLKEAGEQGRSKASYVSMVSAMVILFALLISLKVFKVHIMPNFVWYMICGVCLTISVLVPGLGVSTLLMPLGLYRPFVTGLCSMDFKMLIPLNIGSTVTLILLARLVNKLFQKHYSVAFHGIVGVVIAATIMIIPFESFGSSLAGASVNIFCIGSGIGVAFILNVFNRKFVGSQNEMY